jgi:hypothetical protein
VIYLCSLFDLHFENFELLELPLFLIYSLVKDLEARGKLLIMMSLVLEEKFFLKKKNSFAFSVLFFFRD